MKQKTTIKLNVTDEERKRLRQEKVKLAEVAVYSVDELKEMLQVPTERAKELHALAEFQQIPSVGIKFAEDLVFLGYYSLEELKGKDGAKLREDYEQKKGFRIDSCVEDQFRLAVYVADTYDFSKKWWDFTGERKAYRAECGYPKDRPVKEWHEVRS